MSPMLSKHFTKTELTRTDTGILNEPCPAEIARLIDLCFEVLEPVRELLKTKIKITSGYRSVQVNRAVGGKATSQHLNGSAADFIPLNCRLEDAYLLIRDSNIPYDQLILEPGWLHISYDKKPRHQHQSFIK
jgi:zinc D-Ala-D-Ala carboxypeptidase